MMEGANSLSQLSTQILHELGTVFRFDGSDLMPSVVGSGSFWTGMTNWINGTPTSKVLSSIDDAWPTS
jgi:alpha-glucoside transport system substrate-binding protein